MVTWDIRRVIDQLTGHDFAKSLIQKEVESNDHSHNHLVQGISDQWKGRFRLKFIVRQGLEWQLDRAMIAIHAPNTDIDIVSAFGSAYENHILENHSPLVTEFLDAVDIQHENGIFDQELAKNPSVDDVKTAVTILKESYPPSDIRLFLAVMGIRKEFWSTCLFTVLDELLEENPSAFEIEKDEPFEFVPDAVVPEHSTILDDIFTKSIVESVAGETGAPPISFIEDAIDELITLNSSRYQSHFHKGFFHALIGSKDSAPSPEENEARRRWRLVGEVFALARQSGAKALVSCWSNNSDDLVSLITERHPAGPRILPILFRALWDENQHSDALGLLRPEVVATCTQDFKGELVEAARSHRIRGRVGDARIIVDALNSAIEMGDGEEQRYLFDLFRERAVCMRTQGHFEQAAEVLTGLLEDSAHGTEGDIKGLLGLCNAKFRRVSEVSCLVEAEQVLTAVERLSDQTPHFQAAINSEQPLAVAIGSHCLGVLAFLKDDFHNAVELLSRARSEAVRSAQTTANGEFIRQIEISLALSIVHAGDESQFLQLSHLLGPVGDSHIEIPEWLGSRMIETVVLISDERVRRELMVALISFSPNARDHLLSQTIEDPSLVPEEIVAGIQAIAHDETRPIGERWDYSHWLSRRFMATREINAANRSLDMLEEMASQRPKFRKSFIELLSVEGRFDGVWSQEEISWSLVGIHEREGDYGGAISILRTQFHVYAAEGSWPEAFGVFDRATRYGLPSEMLEDIEGRLRGEFESTEMPYEPDIDESEQEPVRVLFVGGNEIQQKYDDGIRKNLADKTPWISVDFEHTGFSGNWGETAKRLVARFPNYDAVVVMRLIRTNLGRALRKATNDEDIVWRSCTGAGRQFIERSIRDGAELAVKNRRNGFS